MGRARKGKCICFAAVTGMILLLFGMIAGAVPVRQTDTTVAAEGNTLVSVPGYFVDPNLDKAVELVNDIRMEACREGLINPSTGEKLTIADYVPIKWSGDLEWIAQTRAAEALVNETHSRPNGESWSSVEYAGVDSGGEVLAWGASNVQGAISMWYMEKGDWVKQNSSAVTGHYTAMINPRNLYMGMACFGSELGGACASAGEFSRESGLREYRQNLYGDCVQIVEVHTSNIKEARIAYQNLKPVVGNTLKMSVFYIVSYDGFMNEYTAVLPLQTPVWSSSRPTAATVTQDGMVTCVGMGQTVISVSFPDGRKATLTFKVTKPKAGSVMNKGDTLFQITKLGKTVEYIGNLTEEYVNIPAVVKLGKVNYKVTSIAQGAFYDNQLVKKVNIGKNITSIGNGAFYNCTGLTEIVIPAQVNKIGTQAFYGCSNLKKLTIKAKNLKAAGIGKNAFGKSGIQTVKVPKGKKKAYNKLLKSRGLAKKAKVK